MRNRHRGDRDRLRRNVVPENVKNFKAGEGNS